MPLSLAFQIICLAVQVSCLAWLVGSVARDWGLPRSVPVLAMALGPVNVLFMLLGKVYGF
jgi:hypothetical protein